MAVNKKKTNDKKRNVDELNIDLDASTTKDDSEIRSILIQRLSGIEGIPYQFMSNVDQRIQGTLVGRKYAEKIVARMPLLFLTPCKPVFMNEFGDSDKNTVVDFLLGDQSNATSELIEGKGRYYALENDYSTYYSYLNCMLSSVAAFLGIYNETITINGMKRKVGTFPWQNEMNDEFKSFFDAAENVIFYLDGMNSVSESFSNETTESSLASQINGFADTANEIRFLFGDKGGAIGNLINSTTEVTSSITSSLSGIVGKLGGGIVGSLADKGVNTVLNGGKIIFPKIWSDSSMDRSYSIDIKLRSPDHDNLSIFLNVLKPYCRLLCMAMPRLMDDNPNGYRAPFMIKANCKGLFNIQYGIIAGMSVTKGAECCWNDNGLPTQIDISLDIQDLYSSIAMSGFGQDKIKDIVSNTAYMDFLANMAGLNIAQMEIGRRIKMYYYLNQTNIKQIPSRVFTKFDNGVTNLMGKLYNKLS